LAQKGGFGLLTKRDEGGAPFFDELAQGLESSAISRRKAIKLGGSALVASALAGLSPSQAEAQPVRPFKALTLYWSPDRQDNFTTGTKQGRNDAIAAGYQYIRNEGYCVRSSRRCAQWRKGTVPLKLYWSEARGDNLTTATQQGEADAKAAGYRFIRIEGYVYSNRPVIKQGATR
jgi:hypothetical protein